MFAQIIPDSVRSPNTFVGSPKDAAMEEDTVHQAQRYMETEETDEKNKAENK